MAIPFAAAAINAARIAGRRLIKKAPDIYKAAKKKYKKSVGERGLLFKDGAIDRGIKRGAGKVYHKLTKVQNKGTKFTTKKGDKVYYTKAGKKTARDGLFKKTYEKVSKAGKKTTHAPTIKKYKKTKFVKGKTGGYKHDIIRTKKESGMAKAAGYGKTGVKAVYEHSNKVKLVGMSSLYGSASGRLSSGGQRRRNKKRRKGM